MKKDYIAAVAGQLNGSVFSASSFVSDKVAVEPTANGRVPLDEIKKVNNTKYALCCVRPAQNENGEYNRSADCRAVAFEVANSISAEYSWKNRQKGNLSATLLNAMDVTGGAENNCVCSCAAVEINHLGVCVSTVGDVNVFLIRGRRLVSISPIERCTNENNGAAPSVETVDIADGDKVLICSNSLVQAVAAEYIIDCIAGHTICEDSVRALLRKAKEANTQEAVSVLLLSFNTSEIAAYRKKRSHIRTFSVLIAVVVLLFAVFLYLFSDIYRDTNNTVTGTTTQTDISSQTDMATDISTSDTIDLSSNSDTKTDNSHLLFGLEIYDASGTKIFSADEEIIKHVNQGFPEEIYVGTMPEKIRIVALLDPDSKGEVTSSIYLDGEKLTSEQMISTADIDAGGKQLTIDIISGGKSISVLQFDLIGASRSVAESDSDV